MKIYVTNKISILQILKLLILIISMFSPKEEIMISTNWLFIHLMALISFYRDHSFSTFVRFSEILTFLTP